MLGLTHRTLPAACTAQGRGPGETGKGRVPGPQCTGPFPGQCLSEYAVVAVPSGSVSPRAGLAGAEGVNWLEEAGNPGITGTRLQRTVAARLEDLELVLWHRE